MKTRSDRRREAIRYMARRELIGELREEARMHRAELERVSRLHPDLNITGLCAVATFLKTIEDMTP